MRPYSKHLRVNCRQGFQEELRRFQQELDGLQQTTYYWVFILYCSSKTQIEEVFRALTKKQKPNMVEFRCIESSLQVVGLELFSLLKWPHIHTILICDCEINIECAELLSKCDFPELIDLYLSKNQIDDLKVQHISHGQWPKLKKVDLSFNKLTSKGLMHIGNANWLQLENLDVIENDFTLQVQQSGNFNFPKLKEIKFGRNRFFCSEPTLTEQVLSKINKQHMVSFQKLDLYDHQTLGKELFNLQRNIGWQNLKQIKMGRYKLLFEPDLPTLTNQQIYAGIYNLCHYNLPELQNLSINFIHLSKSALKNFKKAKWEHLNQLCLTDCSLQLQSVKIFSKCEWKKLNLVNLSFNYVDDFSVNFLTCCHSKELSKVVLDDQSSEPRITSFGLFTISKLFKETKKFLKLNSTKYITKVIKKQIQVKTYL